MQKERFDEPCIWPGRGQSRPWTGRADGKNKQARPGPIQGRHPSGQKELRPHPPGQRDSFLSPHTLRNPCRAGGDGHAAKGSGSDHAAREQTRRLPDRCFRQRGDLRTLSGGDSWTGFADKFRPDKRAHRGRVQGPVGFHIGDVFQLRQRRWTNPEDLPIRAGKSQMPTGIHANVSALLSKIVFPFCNHTRLLADKFRKKGIVQPFLFHRGFRSMPRTDDGLSRQGKNLRPHGA